MAISKKDIDDYRSRTECSIDHARAVFQRIEIRDKIYNAKTLGDLKLVLLELFPVIK